MHLVAWSFWLSPVPLTAIPSQPFVPLSQLLDFSLLPDSLSSCSDPNMDSCSQLCVLLSPRFPARCTALKGEETFTKCPPNTESCTRLCASLVCSAYSLEPPGKLRLTLLKGSVAEIRLLLCWVQRISLFLMPSPRATGEPACLHLRLENHLTVKTSQAHSYL